jgi:hypothetical protein
MRYRQPFEWHRSEQLSGCFRWPPAGWCDTPSAVEAGNAGIRCNPVRAISTRKQIGHPGIGQSIGGSIRDEFSAVEAAQAVDGAEPQEPAGVADDAADASVRQAVFDRVDTNRQPLGVGRGHCGKEQTHESAQTSKHGAPSILDQNVARR